MMGCKHFILSIKIFWSVTGKWSLFQVPNHIFTPENVLNLHFFSEQTLWYWSRSKIKPKKWYFLSLHLKLMCKCETENYRYTIETTEIFDPSTTFYFIVKMQNIAIWLVEKVRIFLIFLIATVQVSMECKMHES